MIGIFIYLIYEYNYYDTLKVRRLEAVAHFPVCNKIARRVFL